MTARLSRALCAAVCVLAAGGCTTGEGEGYVRSDRLYVGKCWNGPFDLAPTFFGANPYADTLMLRVQRGDNIQELSDGLSVLVNGVAEIRGDGDAAGLLDQPLELGLPSAVDVIGVEDLPRDAPVSLVLYLHDTCHAQIGTLYSIAGTITFRSLFSGDVNESSADDRLTEAEFSGVQFADPRDLAAGSSVPGDVDPVSLVDGYFRFFFQRGKPAQPFP